jgi:hypothetical protein
VVRPPPKNNAAAAAGPPWCHDPWNLHEISMKCEWFSNSGRSGSFWVKCVISWDFWNGIDSTTKRYQTDIPTSITRNVGFQEYDEQKLQKQLVNLN